MEEGKEWMEEKNGWKRTMDKGGLWIEEDYGWKKRMDGGEKLMQKKNAFLIFTIAKTVRTNSALHFQPFEYYI